MMAPMAKEYEIHEERKGAVFASAYALQPTAREKARHRRSEPSRCPRASRGRGAHRRIDLTAVTGYKAARQVERLRIPGRRLRFWAWLGSGRGARTPEFSLADQTSVRRSTFKTCPCFKTCQ